MKKILLYIIKIYKKAISPLMVRLFGNGCRYNPTCSEFAYRAIDKFGIIKGLKISILRFLRCSIFSHRDNYYPLPTK